MFFSSLNVITSQGNKELVYVVNKTTSPLVYVSRKGKKVISNMLLNVIYDPTCVSF